MDDRRIAEARRRLIEEIAEEARQTAAWTGRGRFSARVMAAMAEVPRHVFVPLVDVETAYDNRPLAIGCGQTISQPYMVAVMSDLLDLGADDRVLEIGTGSGYQAAVLSRLAGRVYTIEIIPELAVVAAARLAGLGFDNVEVRQGDGHDGWPEAAPFDAVIVTAAPTEVPPALVAQLRPGGRLVVPVGAAHDIQTLFLGVRQEDGGLLQQSLLPVAFVPMVHGPAR